MSTLKTVNIQHPSSASVNAGTDTSGNFLMNSGYGSAATAYGCRAWVNFNGTGTVAIRGSGNVSSITDNGTGDYTVNFTNAMPDANYSTVTTAPSYDTGNFSATAQVYGSATIGSPTLYSASQVRVCYGASTTLYDPLQLYVAVFR